MALATDETPPVPYRVLEVRSPKSEIRNIAEIVAEEQIDVVVMGRPKAMNRQDRATEIEKETEQFVETLKSQISIPILYEDERLSSRGADAIKKEYGASGPRDAVAAMLILDSYLTKTKDTKTKDRANPTN